MTPGAPFEQSPDDPTGLPGCARLLQPGRRSKPAKDEDQDAEDFREELRSFATAFEFIVIGAAHLEGAGVPCVCR
jgi:hypothetical protein